MASEIESGRPLIADDSIAFEQEAAGSLGAHLAENSETSSLWTQIVLGILLMRSALDLYSGKSLPAVFAIAVDLLVFVFIGRQLILRKPIHTDRFWWLLMGWVALQGIWVALLPVGGLGGTAFMAYEAMREWVRFFSLGMVYLLTMQLRDRISPDRLVSILLLSLVIPLFLAALQIARVDLPGFLQSDVGWKDFEGTGDRINSTLGHYNSFATFTLLFIALTTWRLQMSRRPWIWAILLGGLLYCLVATKSLTGLVMLIVFGGLYFLPRLGGKGILGALALVVTLWILLSTELGQERLMELGKTPLLNPDLTFHEAAVLQAADMEEFRNSFNWRLLQWRDLISDWRLHPWLGYGLASTKELSVFNTTSHNDYLRFLLEGGIVGLGLFLAFLLAQIARTLQIMRRALPRSPQRELAQALFPYSVALAVGMAAGNVMVHTATFFYWWVLLAVLGWDWPRRFGEASTERQLKLERNQSARRRLIASARAGKGPVSDGSAHETGSGRGADRGTGRGTDRGAGMKQVGAIAPPAAFGVSSAPRKTVAAEREERDFMLEVEGIAVARAESEPTETSLAPRYTDADDADDAFDMADIADDIADIAAYDEDIYRSDRYDLDGDISDSF